MSRFSVFFLPQTKMNKCTKLSSFIPTYVLKVFTEGFVHISFTTSFMDHFVPKKMAKIHFLFAVDNIFPL